MSVYSRANEAPSTWANFTPSWTNLTVGNGTQEARYRFVGNGSVHIRVQLTLGSTSSVGSGPYFDLPVSVSGAHGNGRSLGNTWMLDSDSTTDYVGTCMTTGGSSRVLLFTANVRSVSATVPFTWATGDVFVVDIITEIAS